MVQAARHPRQPAQIPRGHTRDQRLHRRHHPKVPRPGPIRGCQGVGADLRRHIRRRGFLHRAAKPRPGDRHRPRPHPAAPKRPVVQARRRAGLEDGGHKRFALPEARGRLPARPHAVHRHEQAGGRPDAHEVQKRPVLPEELRGDGRGAVRASRVPGHDA